LTLFINLASQGGGVCREGERTPRGRRGRYVCTETLIPIPMIGHACTREFAGCPRRVHAISHGHACPRVHASSDIFLLLLFRIH